MEEKKTLWQKFKSEMSNFTSPFWLILVIIGFNSALFDTETVMTFNLGHRITVIPIPTLGRVVGMILLTFPVWGIIFRPVARAVSGYSEKRLPTEEQPEEKQPKTNAERFLKYAKALMPF